MCNAGLPLWMPDLLIPSTPMKVSSTLACCAQSVRYVPSTDAGGGSKGLRPCYTSFHELDRHNTICCSSTFELPSSAQEVYNHGYSTGNVESQYLHSRAFGKEQHGEGLIGGRNRPHGAADGSLSVCRHTESACSQTSGYRFGPTLCVPVKRNLS
ncbi:hypothetical protein LZ30DRAFT_683712 [Colletotrichum cereale]|nr:hypothetical protein LZ30DRAFT_683712 [Colletotrichum cereale]